MGYSGSDLSLSVNYSNPFRVRWPPLTLLDAQAPRDFLSRKEEFNVIN